MAHLPPFASNLDWQHFAAAKDITLPSDKPATPIHHIASISLDYVAARARQQREHAQWRSEHPLSQFNYVSSSIAISARDGHLLDVKISHPDPVRLGKHQGAAKDRKLPVVFVTMGGGWIQGTHTTEQCWLLWPLYEVFDLVIVSVAYRLGPENESPIWVEDSCDVLQEVLSGKNKDFTDFEKESGVHMDLDRLILAGSSAGAGISAALSQRCRDEKIDIFGVILNVPVLCDWRHFERAEKETGSNLRSYEPATEAMLPSGAMKWIWETLYPDPKHSLSPDASPLLGDVRGLPKHMVFVAGQDALCDEGLAYANKLKDAGVSTYVELYEGVPHIFGELWELETTRKWWTDVRRCLGQWLDERSQ